MPDVGDPIPALGVTTSSNSTGALTDPTTLTLTLTLPDGTTKVGTYPAAPGDTLTITRASVGVYASSHITAIEGRYVARWVAVGGGTDGAHEDSWTAGGPDDAGIISLAEAKEQLRISGAGVDATVTPSPAGAGSTVEGV